jgi:hypothetical protein
MSYELIGFFITTIGEFLIGYSVLRVHSSLGNEKSFDDKFLKEVKKEKFWTILGMVLIGIGFLIQLFSERFAI